MKGEKKMKRLAIVLILLFIAAGVVEARDYEISKKSGALTVTVKIDKNPPVTGINKMTVEIKDAAGKAITDAEVAVDYGMPPMPGMGAMNYKTKAALKNKSYQATINFSMSGPWFINIKINRGGTIQTVKLNVDIK
jgi:hypothetical protein